MARRVLVTGGSRGIGRAVAERFQAEGYDVLTPTRAELDLANIGSIRRYVEHPNIGMTDILINNAAENQPTALLEIEPEAIVHTLSVNVTAPFLLTRYLGVLMAQRGWGRIVNVSSVYGMVGRSKRSMYTTSKAAINGLTKAAAVELGPGGVLVNSICPGFVDTDLTRQNNTPAEIAKLCAQVPLGRLAQPSEIADAIYFLGSEANSYITGQFLVIDGGFISQ